MIKQIQGLIDVFTQIAVSIFIFSSIYIALFYGVDVPIHLSYIWGVFSLAFFATLLRIPLIFSKEMTKIQMLIYNIIYFALINTAVLIAGYYLDWFIPSEKKMIIGMEITVIVVFFMVMFFMHTKDMQVAEKMNEKLKNRQKSDNK